MVSVTFLFHAYIFLSVRIIDVRGAVCPDKMFSRDCTSACHCKDDIACDVITGACSTGCASGWDGASCQRANVAYNKQSQQKDGRLAEESSFAVDDDFTTCSSTKANVPGWWMVRLDHVTEVDTVQILSGPTVNVKDTRVYVGMEDSIYSMTLCAIIDIYGNGATIQCDIPVVGQYIMVVNRMAEVILCNFEVYVCSLFWYGESCNKRCNCADVHENCDTETGACATGCRSGWTGSDCQTKCVHRYGPDCSTPCGHCLGDSQCDSQTGHCPRGCQPGWTGNLCHRGCDDDTYGHGCTLVCGHCQGNSTCDSASGRCPDGCSPGYRGDRCDKECERGWYGENCLSQCGQCAGDMECDVTSGLCPEGCSPGWEGVFCTQDCMPGFYGEKCVSQCQVCLHDNCEPVTGACRDGCGAGYQGGNCTQNCSMGYYGQNCQYSCGHCLQKNDVYCNVRNGTCVFGCEPGFNGSLCNQTCKTGYYGDGCKKCGVCKAGTHCHVITGVCPDGCGLNFYGDQCLQADAFADEDGPQLQVFLGATIGFVGGIMTIVVVCLVFTWQREHLPTMAEIKIKSTKQEISLLESRSLKDFGRSDKVEVV